MPCRTGKCHGSLNSRCIDAGAAMSPGLALVPLSTGACTRAQTVQLSTSMWPCQQCTAWVQSSLIYSRGLYTAGTSSRGHPGLWRDSTMQQTCRILRSPACDKTQRAADRSICMFLSVYNRCWRVHARFVCVYVSELEATTGKNSR